VAFVGSEKFSEICITLISQDKNFYKIAKKPVASRSFITVIVMIDNEFEFDSNSKRTMLILQVIFEQFLKTLSYNNYAFDFSRAPHLLLLGF